MKLIIGNLCFLKNIPGLKLQQRNGVLFTAFFAGEFTVFYKGDMHIKSALFFIKFNFIKFPGIFDS